MKFLGGRFSSRNLLIRCSVFLNCVGLFAAFGCNERPGIGVTPGQEETVDAAVDARPSNPYDAFMLADLRPIEPRDTKAADVYVGGCGDKLIQPGEDCDDGNSKGGDGCSADCKQVEQDYACPTQGEMCVYLVVCGDNKIAGNETCDDGNKKSADGCDDKCQREPGWECAKAGDRCQAKMCGDGIIAGQEQCDDGANGASDGCSDTCKLVEGFHCPTAGQPCLPTVCNDGKRQGLEPCDDGNMVVGDGCTPFCELEPDCSKGACKSRCGDGLILASDMEDCDDGNTLPGDGCSEACKIEDGFACTAMASELTDELKIPVTYRDMIALPTGGKMRHPDFEAFSGSGVTADLVKTELTADGKPDWNNRCTANVVTDICPYKQQMTTKEAFDQWYRDVPGVNVTKVDLLPLKRQPSGSYFFPPDGNAGLQLFPFDGAGWVAAGGEVASNANGQLPAAHNFGFTSEVRHYFTFKGGETLTFSGDDDVWVFINRRLALDLGGVHKRLEKTVTLDAAKAAALGLEAGKVYEFVLFHAERHTRESNFNLTLNGFVKAKSTCGTTCGDKKVAGAETCDDGKNDNSYGSCTPDCRLGPRCGDRIKQDPQEECDDGSNLTPYKADGTGCAPGCKRSASCGDGKLDAAFGEQCDNGTDANTGGYGKCRSDCRLDVRCGDGITQRDLGEVCDDGDPVGGNCPADCKEIP